MRTTQERKNEIIQLHALGLIDKEIGEKLGVCSDAIYYHRKRLGLPANGPTKASLVFDKNGLRICSKCGNPYPDSFYERDGGNSYRRYCNLCRRKQARGYYDEAKLSLEKSLITRCRYWRKRAKDENIPFEINYDYAMDILQKQNFKCFYSELEMFLDGTREDHHYSLSIDKVVPSLGYIKGNVVFCIHKINLIKNNMTLSEIREWTPKFYKRIIKSKFLDLKLILVQE